MNVQEVTPVAGRYCIMGLMMMHNRAPQGSRLSHALGILKRDPNPWTAFCSPVTRKRGAVMAQSSPPAKKKVAKRNSNGDSQTAGAINQTLSISTQALVALDVNAGFGALDVLYIQRSNDGPF